MRIAGFPLAPMPQLVDGNELNDGNSPLLYQNEKGRQNESRNASSLRKTLAKFSPTAFLP